MRKLDSLYTNREGPWFVRTDQLFEYIIKEQSTIAARNIPLVHFFRFLAEGSGYDDIQKESQITERKYADPVTARIYIDFQQKQKPLEKYGVDAKQEHTVSVDIAECIRLGEIFGLTDPAIDFHFYLPRSGDVYQWDNSLFKIIEMKQEVYYQLLQRYVVWKGEAELYRTDSTNPLVPLKTLPTLPDLEHPVWI